jgi:hypothetical protein
MELDLRSLFGLHVYTVQLYSLAETPSPPFGSNLRALLVSQDRRHLFVTPYSKLTTVSSFLSCPFLGSQMA